MSAPELVACLQELVDHDDERPVVVDTGDFGGFRRGEVVAVERYDDAVVVTVKPWPA